MTDGPMYIEINMPEDNTSSLIANLRSLQPVEKEETPVILSDIQSTKKDTTKKKKKKKSVLSTIIRDTDMELTEENDPSRVDDETVLLDIDEIMELRERNIDDDDIIKGRKKDYSKLKKDANAFKKEFADEIRLLYGLLDETTKFGKEIEKDIEKLRGSKVRGTSKYANDLISTAISSKQTKLSIIKEIVGVKKTIADLTAKAEAKKKDESSAALDSERLASRFLKSVLTNRQGFLEAITSEDEPEDTLRLIEDHGELPIKEENADQYWSDKLDERLTYTVNPDRSDIGDAYIKYENAGVEVFISRCVDTGEWEMTAVDRDGNELDDYPVPTRKELGRVKFSMDGSYATDESGRMYKVRDYYLEDDDESEE